MRLIRMTTAIVTLLSSAIVAEAGIIQVPGDSTTIEAGIDGAANGDTVMIAQGTFNEFGIDFLGKGITVMSTDPMDSAVVAATVVDAGLQSTVFYFRSGEDSTSVLSGLTITAGRSTMGGGICCENSSSPAISYNVIAGNSVNGGNGGGISCADSSSPTISNNIISDNSVASGKGGGVSCTNFSSPIITHNTIVGDTVGPGGGGAISCENSSSPIISYNTISENRGYNSCGAVYSENSSPTISHNTITNNYTFWYGGAIYSDQSVSTITDNTISGNEASHYGGGIFYTLSSQPKSNNSIPDNFAYYSGGGIYTWGSFSIITNNVITGNSSNLKGGGIRCGSSSPTLANNTISGNSSGVNGGGISGFYLSSPTIVNTIFWDNVSPKGSEIYVGTESEPSTFTFSHTTVKGGLRSTHVDAGCTLNWGDGMISADPLFADPDSGDYHLTSQSPCIDAGIDSVVLSDFEGDPRPVGNSFDIGYDESPDTVDLNLSITPIGPLTVIKGENFYSYTLIQNNTEDVVAGDYWVSVLLPDSSEILVPGSTLNYPNPLYSQIYPYSFHAMMYEFFVPTVADTGSYRLIGRFGGYPDTILDEETIDFHVKMRYPTPLL